MCWASKLSETLGRADEGKDGIYAFDFAGGELTQFLHIKELTGIIVVHK